MNQKSDLGQNQGGYAGAISSIHGELVGNQITASAGEVTSAVLRLEGFRGGNNAEVTLGNMSNIEGALRKLASAMAEGSASLALDKDGKEIESVGSYRFKQRNEGFIKRDARDAYAMAVDPNAWSSRQLTMQGLQGSTKTQTAILQQSGMSGGYSQPKIRMEQFNQIDTHATLAFSMGNGASISRQTDFVMGWYPPITMSPDQTALEVRLTLATVFNGAVHDTDTGNMVSFQRRNVARAFENPNILNRFATLAMPIWTEGRKEHFVDTTLVAPKDVTFGNRKIHTSWLKFANDFNILGLGTTKATIDTQGSPTHRESLEPGTKMEAILLKNGADLISLPMLNLRTMNFIGTNQFDQAETTLQGNVTLGLSGNKLKNIDGGELAGPLKYLVDNKLIISVQMKMNGNLNIETGNAAVAIPTMRLVRVESTETGQVFEADSATFKQVETLIKTTTSEGFRFRPFKTNSTKREQGDRLNSRRFVFQYIAPYRDPVSVERQIDKAGDHDAQDVIQLQGLLKIRIENEAVDHMFDMFDLMEAYVDMGGSDGVLNDLPGLAQFWTIPCFHKETLKLNEMVDNRRSAEKAVDIAAALCMKLRDVATRLLTFSQWKAAMIMQNNDTAPEPQINIFTSPIIARYLFSQGDMRTFGDYDYVITTSLNRRIAGKIAMSFRIPGSEASNEVSIFGWGHLLTTAEIVFAANMIRNSDYFSELQIQPRYDFMPMNLTGALFELEGIPEVLGKIAGYSVLKGPMNVESKLVNADELGQAIADGVKTP